MSTAAIETNGLTKEYHSLLSGKDIPAVDHLDLAVPQGTVFGYLGPNGAGKSTTLKLLLDLTHPTEGTAKILGRKPGDTRAKSKIGYMPEKQNFYNYLTARELLDYSAKFYKMKRSQRRKTIPRLLEYVGLEDVKGARIKTFSLGMKRRLGMAEAMLNDPELLLLDEPLSGLDPLGRKHFKDLIKRLSRNEGKTVFLCSHVLAEVETICEMVGILSRGRLLLKESMDKLPKMHRVEFTIEDATEETVEALRKAGMTVEIKDGRAMASTLGQQKAEKAREVLQSYPGECLEETVTSESLEEFFVRVINESEEGEKHA
ncbi:MAG: ABC transporter ATP-binding protein [Planctomycetes bacterium]|nr:ABC transporter ATP-binding protein [Planctomycetota bacterium]